jgi:tetratricopeptide (TPR) repeat protein
MKTHTSARVSLILPLILISFWSGLFASPAGQTVQTRSPLTTQGNENTPARAVRRRRDPEFAAILKAEHEGRLLDAERLLEAAIAKAGAESESGQRLHTLLNNLGSVEFRMGHYSEAVAATRRALAMDEPVSDGDSYRALTDFQNLAMFSERAGDWTAAGDAFRQELALARRNPVRGDLALIAALTQLEEYDRREHNIAEVKALQAEAAKICRNQPDSTEMACQGIQGDYYRETDHAGYFEEMLSGKAEQAPGSGSGSAAAQPAVIPEPHSREISVLAELARQYELDHSYELEAEAYRQIIQLADATKGNPVVLAGWYDGLGRVLSAAGEDEDAETAYKHSFDLREQATGRSRESAIASLSNTPLVFLYRRQGRLPDAEAVLRRALTDQELALDAKDDHLAQTLVELARVESEQGEYSEAEPDCERALKIQEADYGADSPRLAPTLATCSEVDRQFGNTAEAEALQTRLNALEQKKAAQGQH